MWKMHRIVSILLTYFLAVSPASSAWYDSSIAWFKGSCKEVPYDREAWGFDKSHKKRILREQAKKPGRINIQDTFIDEYTGDILSLNKFSASGEKIANAHVDHVIPLSYMHKNGGCHWSAEKKKKFANDKDNLKLISAHSNTSKGAKSPSYWLPSQHNRESQINYLKSWNEVADKYNAPTFKLKAYLLKNSKFVKYTRKILKSAGYVGAAGLARTGAGAVALALPAAVEAADEVVIISEDPDAYFSEIATDFSSAYNISVEWTSYSWNATKKWSDKSWSDASNWTADSWTGIVKKTRNGWESTKDYSQFITDAIVETYNEYNK